MDAIEFVVVASYAVPSSGYESVVYEPPVRAAGGTADGTTLRTRGSTQPTVEQCVRS